MKPILFCEPQCHGFEHSEINAALLMNYIKNFPNSPIILFSERTHYQFILLSLQKKGIQSAALEFVELKTPERNYSSLRRFFPEKKLYQSLFQKALELGQEKIIFLSTTAPGLFWIKYYLRQYSSLCVSVIMHGILHTVARPPVFRPQEFFFYFKWIFLFGNLPRLQYVLLSPSIENELKKLFPKLRANLLSIHHPYFFYPEQKGQRLCSSKIRFGYFGIVGGKKRANYFFSLAKETKLQKKNADFFLVGYVADSQMRKALLSEKNVTVSTSSRPLARAEYEEMALELDYALFFYEPDAYRLMCSGAFFDALSFQKPIIAIRNPFFQYYFDTFGEMGYLCDSYQEVRNLVFDLIDHPPKEQYERQVKNILNARSFLESETQTNRIKQIWTE